MNDIDPTGLFCGFCGKVLDKAVDIASSLAKPTIVVLDVGALGLAAWSAFWVDVATIGGCIAGELVFELVPGDGLGCLLGASVSYVVTRASMAGTTALSD